MTRAICSLSGGMDSSTILGEAIEQGREVQCVGFRYGSKHNKFENNAAFRVADYYGVPFRLIDLSGVMGSFKSALMLSGDKIPEGHYEEENMRQTVVPNRNAIFISILTGLAISNDCQEVWIGTHAGDFQCYPDCRPSFIEAMQRAIWAGTKWEDTDPSVTLKAPFIFLHKLDILKHGFSYKKPVPYHLTRTCYTDNEISCGKCGACCERREAFQLLGKEDPIPYQYTGQLPKKPE